jgi:alpha-tubulin suppressor-like RCC1 family protein
VNVRAAVLGLIIVSLYGCNDPFSLAPTRAYKAVATGGDHTCAVSEAGEAYCWGRGIDGELGNGAKDNYFTPSLVRGNLVFDQITAGENHTCALTTDGSAFCWGWTAFYQLGNNVPSNYADAEPIPVTTNLRFRSISAGSHHTCALSLDSLAYCWGLNRYGQVGDGTTITPVVPKAVQGSLKFVSISAGAWHTCALTAAATAYCWGRNDLGQLGLGSAVLLTNAPALVNTAVRFRQIDGGYTHTCAVALDTKFYCWGSNEYGEAGDGSYFKPGIPGATSPALVSDHFPTGTAISAGAGHTCAIGPGQLSRCWGRGDLGQLANGANVHQAHPQPFLLFAVNLPVTAFATGGLTHSCALVDRSVFCWGQGSSGQLGLAQLSVSFLPQRVRD